MWKFFIGIVLTLLVSANAWGLPIPTGSITYGDGIYATAGWADEATTLSWEIRQISGLWSYHYTFEVPDTSHNISHIILQLSDNFTEDNISNLVDGNGAEIADEQYEVRLFSSGGSNPGLPGTLYGLKIDLQNDVNFYEFTLLTERSPMLGNFYAKNGVDEDGIDGEIDCFAFSGSQAGFGYNVPVPDTVVPEPGTFVLLGLGVVGLAAYIKRSSNRT